MLKQYTYSLQFPVSAYKGTVHKDNLMERGLGTLTKDLISPDALIELASDSTKVAIALAEAVENLKFVDSTGKKTR